MARISNSDLKKPILPLNQNGNGDFLTKCNFKLHYPPLGPIENIVKPLKEPLKENQFRSKKFTYQCPYGDHRRRTESRRKKIIQKLNKFYNINVEDLNDKVANEIIQKVDIWEREKRERKKRNVEKTMKMISKLLEEQKYKRKGNKIQTPLWRRRVKNVPSPETIFQSFTTEEKGTESLDRDSVSNYEKEKEFQRPSKRISTKKSSEGVKSNFQEQTTDILQGEDTTEPDDLVSFKSTIRPKPCRIVSIEKNLECTPRRIVFEDCKNDKVYLQELKITNVGLTTVHCRYLGILVHVKSEKRFPIGVAVRDNVKLRPGLSFSTKVRFCSGDITEELECSIVYETRRQNKPLHHSCFFVRVLCVPARAMVKITPTKITFPMLTWCEATSPEGSKQLRKILKIENTGGVGCSCKISTQSRNMYMYNENEEISGEEEERGQTVAAASISGETSRESRVTEFFGEGFFPSYEAMEMAERLAHELVNNVFDIFRFSDKYHIEIPPFSTRKIEILFTPEYKGFHQQFSYVQFENCFNCDEETVELSGNIKNLPLRAYPEVIDLKTCVLNSGVYSATFKVFNTSKGPYSIRIKIPSSVKKHAHVHPRATTIQAYGHCNVSVRIYPRITLSQDAFLYFNEDSQILEFPVFIYSANLGTCKSDYIQIFVFGLITDYALELSPAEIDFGIVSTTETVRTQLELTNHSLATQEYGFLNLPKGVRVEPNMGFGYILPKETISLHLLYSPEMNFNECNGKMDENEHLFQVTVTTIAEYGGFREKLIIEEDKEDSIWGEEEYEHKSLLKINDLVSYETKKSIEEEEEEEEGEDYEPCLQEDSSIEGEQLCAKIEEQEMKIRDYLKQDRNKTSEESFFKRMSLKEEKDTGNLKENLLEHEGEAEESLELFIRPEMNVVKCRAVVLEPHCQISASIIQLPATPCSSLSLYRFQLIGSNDSINATCTCGLKNMTKKSHLNSFKPKFEASFEFKFVCPYIKIEPQSGFFKAGDSLPITIIYKPEFPAEQLLQELRAQKSKVLQEAEINDSNTVNSATQKGNATSSLNKQTGAVGADQMTETVKISPGEWKNNDLFAGERRLQELINPFTVETKITCIIKTQHSDDQTEQTEFHDLVLICPAVKPNFVYLGDCQEVDFKKVFIGTSSKMLIEVQNISFERICPRISLLNPVGPFSCPAGLRKVEVDPEHIWRVPLTYTPLEFKEVPEKEYFEIFCESTNISLMAKGEGIVPDFQITPNFVYCRVETKMGYFEEIKIEMQNPNALNLRVQIAKDFIREGLDSEKREVVETEESKTEKEIQKKDSTGKKKLKNTESERKNVQMSDQIPEAVLSEIETFKDVSADRSSIFTLIGLDENNEALMSPYASFQFRIRYCPPKSDPERGEPGGFRKYAVKYKFMLQRSFFLKEVLLLGLVSKGM